MTARQSIVVLIEDHIEPPVMQGWPRDSSDPNPAATEENLSALSSAYSALRLFIFESGRSPYRPRRS